MPELPEVETVRRGLEPALKGRTIREVELRRADLRIPFPDDMHALLEGTVILSVKRRSKYLLVDIQKNRHSLSCTATIGESIAQHCGSPYSSTTRNSGDDDGLLTLIIHLGMSGKVLLETQGYAPKKHDHVILSLDDGTLLVYNDARRFGLMTLCPTDALEALPLLAHLAPEPFSDAFSPAYLYAALQTRKSPIKHALMDASVVVGVGNIYAAETLFRCGIHPTKPANTLMKKSIPPLLTTIRTVLQEAIDSGGSTLRDYVRSDGSLGYFQHQFLVYGRENKPCTLCTTPIERMQQQGRSTFFCPRCQRK